jgi:hypothetical protein
MDSGFRLNAEIHELSTFLFQYFFYGRFNFIEGKWFRQAQLGKYFSERDLFVRLLLSAGGISFAGGITKGFEK